MKKLMFILVLAVMILPLSLFAGGGRDADAAAANWPTRTVTMVVPYGAGGDTDIYARITAQHLSEYFGRNFIVVNMPGANSVVGAEHVRAAAPDGYTLLFCHSHGFHQEAFGGIIDFSYIDDFDLMANAVQDNTFTLFARTDSGWRNLHDLNADARARPGQITFSQVWAGHNDTIYRIMVQSTGVDLRELDVGGGGADRTVAFLGGQVDTVLLNYLLLEDYVETGLAVPLAISSPSRLRTLPNVPTFAEQGVPSNINKNYQLIAPKGINRAIAQRLDEALLHITRDPVFARELERYHATPYFRDAATNRRAVAEEIADIRRIVGR